ncbi:MAG: S28 family serine protease [Legionella sp.]|jgi:pimeloyl-ACP methyl ester carboxylesterase
MQIAQRLSLILLLISNSISNAGPLDFYYQNKQLPTAPSSVQVQMFKQLLNHIKPDKGSFNQRYYIDETYGPNNDAPVFFYICGQNTCTPNVLTGAIREYAQKYHAKLVALEHRYYGESIPVANFSVKEMRFLKTERVLGDLANFQQQISSEKKWTGRWIAFGSSYAGSLAAYYRLHYPQLIAGAIASSAPVMATNNFYEYDKEVTQQAGTQCAQAIRNVVSDIESNLNNPSNLAHYKALFGVSKVKNPIDLLSLIADVAAVSIQQGHKEEFCSALLSSFSPVEAYAQFAKNVYKEMHITAYDLTPQAALSEKVQDYKHDFGLRQWYYQSCTEYGDWQNANPNPFLTTRSLLINAKYHQEVCKRLFGITSLANTELINKTYYLPLRTSKASHIYFTNGELDAWSHLSMTEANNNTENTQLYYYEIVQGKQSDDLLARNTADSKSLQFARTMTELLNQEWMVGCLD